MLPVHFGPWQTIYWWFRRFVRRLLFRTIHDVALMLDREAAGREPIPSLGGKSYRLRVISSVGWAWATNESQCAAGG
jgi:transposase